MGADEDRAELDFSSMLSAEAATAEQNKMQLRKDGDDVNQCESTAGL
jgi:hypothetical protein